MNFITTNIRLPEDLYMEIKMEALEKKKSFGALVRDRLSKKNTSKKTDSDKFIEKLNKFAKENSKYFNGKSAVQIIREMRDEQ